jgi:uncharacterized MAPEG superfamily protein
MTIGYWCVLAAILLPYVCFGIARNRGRGPDGRRLRDNSKPREFPNVIDGPAKRAWDAHLNAFEALPVFGLAVIIAHLAHAAQRSVDILALTWVVARIGHAAFYILNKPWVRSAMQFVSLACVLALFIVSA